MFKTSYVKTFKSFCVFALFISMCSLVFGQEIDRESFLPNCNKEVAKVDISNLLANNNRSHLCRERDSLRQLYCLSKQLPNKELEALILYKLSEHVEIIQNVDDLREIYSVLTESLKISEDNDYHKIWFWSMSRFTTLFTTNEMLFEANVYAEEFITKSLVLKDSLWIAEGYMLQGRIKREQGLYKEANSLLGKALDYQKSTYSNKVLSYTYLHLSNLKRRQKEYQKAIKFANRGMLYAKKSREHSTLLYSFLASEIVEANLAMGIFNNEEMFELVENITEGEEWNKISYHTLRGDSYALQGEFEAAKNSYLEGLRLAEELGTSKFVITSVEKIFKLNEDIDIGSENLRYISRLANKAYKDVSSQKNENQLFRATLYQLESEREKNATLSTYSISLLGLVLFLIIIVYLVYRQHNLRYKYYESTAQLNNELTSSVERLSVKSEKLRISNKRLAYLVDRRDRVINRLSRFSAVLAHDYKEPFQTINTFAGLLKRTAPEKLNDSENEFLEYIANSTKRLSLMLERLYKHSTSTLALLKDFSSISLNKIIRDVTLDLSVKIEETNATIVVKSLARITGDEFLIYQLFQNIIANALKYKRSGVRPIIEIDTTIKEDTLIVTIADNGMGIEVSPNLDLFALNVRGDGSDSHEGGGLGLATCKEIIDIHGGKIWYDSIVGQGTTIYISFTVFEPDSLKLYQSIKAKSLS